MLNVPDVLDILHIYISAHLHNSMKKILSIIYFLHIRKLRLLLKVLCWVKKLKLLIILS